MNKCKLCGDYSFDDECHCSRYLVIDSDGEEYDIYSSSPEGAAIKFAEKTNTEDDYYLMNSTEIITVDGEEFTIGAEPDVYYFAKQVETKGGE